MTTPEAVPLAQAIEEFTEILQAASVPSFANDAKLLTAHFRGQSLGELDRDAFLDVMLNHDDYVAIKKWAKRRASREPLQHIVGWAAFRQLELLVGPGVFVPRPETEQLVEYALEFLASEASTLRIASGDPQINIVDFGSGSGAIAISLATEFQPEESCDEKSPAQVDVYAVEKSDRALPWLTKNVSRYQDLHPATGVTPPHKIHVVEADMQTAFNDYPSKKFWMIVSNPPYIPEAAIPQDEEVRDWDPEAALYSGADGLDLIRVLAIRAMELLEPQGLLIIEHGEDQGEKIREIFTRAGLSHAETLTDFTGRERFTKAQYLLH